MYEEDNVGVDRESFTEALNRMRVAWKRRAEPTDEEYARARAEAELVLRRFDP